MASKKINKVRTRFAPSPTGSLHLGGARTALFNWLWAKSQSGEFILRIEDTDQERFDPQSQIELIENLKWLGLNWEEGPQTNGPHAPYIQSQRLPIYKKHIDILLKQGQAYHCFCSCETLAKVKDQQKKSKTSQTGYNRTCRNLTNIQVQENLNANIPFVIRLKIPLEGETSFQDFLRGTITYQNQNIDDLILFKSNGFPSYHLANVVDDHLMQITHVLRGEEWIPSAIKHILLYQYFDWSPPIFVHLPLILSSEGGKLSKRHGSVSLSHYQKEGFLPQAFKNFLALLGWSPGNNQELFSQTDLIQTFSLERIQAKACSFDLVKLNWFNQQTLQKMSTKSLLLTVTKLFKKNLDLQNLDLQNLDLQNLVNQTQNLISDQKIETIITLLKERCQKIDDFWNQGKFFFCNPVEYYPAKVVKKVLVLESISILETISLKFSTLHEFSTSNIEATCLELAEHLTVGLGKINLPLRLAVSGTNTGPSLFPTLALLGLDVVNLRINNTIDFIKNDDISNVAL